MTQATLPDLFPPYDCDECGETLTPNEHPQCSNCDHCGECCDCKACGDCGQLNDETSRCGNCLNCDSGCCECWYCEHCGETHEGDVDKCSCCGSCEDECNCWTCPSCRSGRDRYSADDFRCSNCECCESHCECFCCDSCGEYCDDSYCGECSRCNSCCDCGDNSGVLRSGTLTFHTATKHQHLTNTSRRHISLELEVSGDDGSGEDHVVPVAEDWDDAIVEDGSLPDSGYEINSNPSSGDVFIRHITELCDGLNAASARVDRSCGMHCHVSATDYSYFDLFKLCKLYRVIEDGLFACVSPSRRNNSYTKQCSYRYNFRHFATFKKDIILELYGADSLTCRYGNKTPSTREHRGKRRLTPMTEKDGQERYNALNLHSFFYRGTIEFRHHQGTTNAAKATRWGMLCASVIDAAQRLTVADIDALSAHTSFDALRLVLTPTLAAWACERRSELAR